MSCPSCGGTPRVDCRYRQPPGCIGADAPCVAAQLQQDAAALGTSEVRRVLACMIIALIAFAWLVWALH